METKPKMLEVSDLRRATLECPFCNGRTAIHVARERRLPELLIWECFDCQKSVRRIRHRKEPSLRPGPGNGGRMGMADRIRAVAGEEKL
jgi:ribosomal protein L37AE/L43A